MSEEYDWRLRIQELEAEIEQLKAALWEIVKRDIRFYANHTSQDGPLGSIARAALEHKP